MKLVALILLIFPIKILAEPPTKAENVHALFVLYYQPLFELKEARAQNYITDLKQILAKAKKESVERLLDKKDFTQKCFKLGMKQCAFFSDPVHNRVEWNKFAIAVNYYCNKNASPLCFPLAELHDKYRLEYVQLMKDRKKQNSQ